MGICCCPPVSLAGPLRQALVRALPARNTTSPPSAPKPCAQEAPRGHSLQKEGPSLGPLAALCPTCLDAENSRLLWVPAPPHQRCPVSSGKQADGMWFWCLRGHGHPPPGRGRQPSVIGSAASKLQEADLKGDQGPGGGAWTQRPADVLEANKGGLAASDSEKLKNSRV